MQPYCVSNLTQPKFASQSNQTAYSHARAFSTFTPDTCDHVFELSSLMKGKFGYQAKHKPAYIKKAYQLEDTMCYKVCLYHKLDVTGLLLVFSLPHLSAALHDCAHYDEQRGCAEGSPEHLQAGHVEQLGTHGKQPKGQSTLGNMCGIQGVSHSEAKDLRSGTERGPAAHAIHGCHHVVTCPFVLVSTCWRPWKMSFATTVGMVMGRRKLGKTCKQGTLRHDPGLQAPAAKLQHACSHSAQSHGGACNHGTAQWASRRVLTQNLHRSSCPWICFSVGSPGMTPLMPTLMAERYSATSLGLTPPRGANSSAITNSP